MEGGGDEHNAEASSEGMGKFLGRKERRRSSGSKGTGHGDYLNLQSNSSIQKILSKNGDKGILFADVVVKVNKRNKMQERILLVTEQSLYNIDPSSFKSKRRISLADIGSFSMSQLPDNFFAVHIPQEYDYLMVSGKKIEIVTKVREAYKVLKGGLELPINFSNSFEYRIDTDISREIVFTKVEGGKHD